MSGKQLPGLGSLGVADEPAVANSAVRKVVWRLVPIFLLCNFANYLDRTNVGFAALTMNHDMGFDATTFGIGAGIFSLGYFVFQIPSSLAAEKFGARKWIAIMMIGWGLISALNAVIWNDVSFYIVRFLLGGAEAGFAPAMIVYFSFWVPRPQRARMLALSGTASILSALIGSPLSGWLLDALHNVSGIPGWRWLFGVESLPAIIMGIVAAIALGARPATAPWLTPAERTWLTDTMEAERREREAGGRHNLGQALSHPRVLLLAITYFFMILSLAGTSMWMPLMVKQFGLSNTQVGWALLVPNAIAVVGLQLWTRHSDRKNERTWHLVVACLVVAVGVLCTADKTSILIALTGMTCIIMGSWSAIAIFWTQPTNFLTGVGAAAAIALINSVGNLSGFFGPYIIGMIHDRTGSFTPSLFGMAGSSVIAAIVMAGIAISDQRLLRDPASTEGVAD
jgi:MFS transporter, ACS family, tartrate transporter